MKDLESAALEHARIATYFNPRTQYHMLKFRLVRAAFLAGAAWAFEKCKGVVSCRDCEDDITAFEEKQAFDETSGKKEAT